jgi:hypothetical protein
MGRRSYSNRLTTHECISLSVFSLRRHDFFVGIRAGVLRWSRAEVDMGRIHVTLSTMVGDEYIHFQYIHTDDRSGEETDLDYKVPLVSTRCHFGGRRWWFECSQSVNGRYCCRRVGVLYLGGKYFGCRHCYNLTYESCREHRTFGEYFLRSFRLVDRHRKLSESISRRFSIRKLIQLERVMQGMERLPARFQELLRGKN